MLAFSCSWLWVCCCCCCCLGLLPLWPLLGWTVTRNHKLKWILSPLNHVLSVCFTVAIEMKLEPVCTHKYTRISKMLTVLFFVLMIINNFKFATMYIYICAWFYGKKTSPKRRKEEEERLNNHQKITSLDRQSGRHHLPMTCALLFLYISNNISPTFKCLDLSKLVKITGNLTADLRCFHNFW